ncbi:HdeD family acid-resistance protein [Ketogulonicigenium vulgare]|uniref:HdeD protein n=1 Tax=Ketogulonicigenium vulgare (strain WSH-001) TaxID=759362 RepID=F9Y703_KETVW|nr:HdeD family acid-resistance protein [Ketogulonicigenium vulgare]ADO41198.1 conserved hypothetical protein [Ketogulonicigenium vulgare Y25]AEM42193.1 hypothetical protein KVU_2354 [Ketogulonicigenium vulgare WSH-001]ALJ79817.1 hypothetical protein KVH_00560 [Ketogulonicigenium vulgare]ANW32732.1 hypothetical protein KvSKV_00570 [Ketogulonicigenium vulgare]AOZ53028.1 HdeD protein [Ketogulonicigenium vulgare]
MAFLLSFGTEVRDELRRNWGWILAAGIVMVLAGVLALGNLFLATVASVYYVGLLMILGGAAQIVQVFRATGWSRLYWLIGGLIYIAAGFVTFSNPVFASSVLTLLLGAVLIVGGVVRIIMGWRVDPDLGKWWIVLAGVVTTLAGLVILIGWPVNSLFVLGAILAIDLLLQGWAAIFLAFAARK